MKTKTSATIVIVLFLAGSVFGQVKKGQKAPDFTLPDLDGNNVTLSEVIGNGPVYINFWATWCGPCKKEMPELVKLYNEYKDRGFKLLGISVDGARTQGKVKSFVKNQKMDFTILLDSDSEVFKRKYKGRGIPYGFLLDNEGNIIHKVRGYLPGIEKTLAEKMKPYLISKEDAKKSESSDSKNAEPEKASTKAINKTTTAKKDVTKN